MNAAQQVIVQSGEAFQPEMSSLSGVCLPVGHPHHALPWGLAHVQAAAAAQAPQPGLAQDARQHAHPSCYLPEGPSCGQAPFLMGPAPRQIHPLPAEHAAGPRRGHLHLHCSLSNIKTHTAVAKAKAVAHEDWPQDALFKGCCGCGLTRQLWPACLQDEMNSYIGM